MPNYWALYHGVHESEIKRNQEGVSREYKAIPTSADISTHDVVFLFQSNEYLYGWGTIIGIGKEYSDKSGQTVRDITVNPHVLHPPLASVETIRQNPVFKEFAWTGDGAVSSLNAEQIEVLVSLLPHDRSKPPMPPREIPDGWERLVQKQALSGGQGSITKVRKTDSESIGALKRLLPHNQQIEERRFRMFREITALDALAGKGTPLLLEHNANEWKNKNVDLYFIQDWIEGPTLRVYISQKRLSLTSAVALTRAILETLKRCHAREIYHRDLKPENIIVKNADPNAPNHS